MLVDPFPDLAIMRAHEWCIIYAVEFRSAKTVNIMRCENLALYGIFL